jgi:thioredoxin 1
MRLIKLSAKWCGPCKLMEPVVHKFEQAYPHVTVDRIDVDKSPEVAKQYGVSSIPTIIVFNDDNSVKEVVKGLVTLEALTKAVWG